MAKVSVDLDIGFKPQGPRNADIVLVIDRPCSVKHKKWLKGSESRLLDSMLRGVGINMHKCYRTVVYKEKKITNKKDQWYQLRMELKRVNPNVIITLGNEPLRAVTQKESISCFDYRGSILGSDCGKVIPTYTPNYIMSQFGDNPIMQLDLARAKRESKTPELNLPERELITNPTMSEIKEFIDHCRLKEFLSFDIETIKGNSENYKYIDCIGLAPTPELSMCIPFCYANGKNLWSIEQEIEIYHMLANLMSIKEIKKIAQNAQFDVSHLEDRGIPVRNLYFDTMNAAKVIEPEFPKGLDFLVSIYTREPYYKDQSEDNRWIYNAKDSACTLEVCEGQIKDLERKGLKDFYFDHVHPLIRCFINVSRQGVNHDEEKMAQLDAEIDKIIEKKRQKLTDILGKRINVKSVIDMRQVLYQDYGMKPRYNKNGNLCTAKETLEEFYRRTGDEAFQLMLDIRKYRSKSSGFTKTEISEDGRIRTSYIVSGTESGRLSSKKYVDGTGMNCQNREKGIEREIFIPDPGMIFVGADLGQAENRVVAYAADDPKMIEVVESEGDVHRENAAMIFDRPVEEITDEERQLGKRITHANNYCMGPMLFAKLANISVAQAKEYQRRYFNTYPRVRVWQKEIEVEVRKTRKLVTPFGRERTFHGRMNDDTFRSAVSYIPQSTVADKLHFATQEIWAQLPHPARIILQLHDEIFIQCLPEQFDEISIIIEEALTRPFEINGYTVSIPTEIKRGYSWNEVS